MKKTQVLLIGMIGILFFSFTSVSVYGRGRGNTQIRPIEDWLYNNPFGIGATWNAGYFGHDRDNNYYWAWPDSPYGFFTGVENDFHGFVKEKVLKDGSLEMTVHLWVKSAYIEVYNALYDEEGNPITTMQYFGDLGDILGYAYCNYYFQFKFVLDAEYEGFEPWGIPPGQREPGCILPYFEAIFLIPEAIGVHVKFLMFIATGEGEIYEPGWRWPEDQTNFPPGPFPAGEMKLHMLFYAKFRGDTTLEWPIGSSGFCFNNILYH